MKMHCLIALLYYFMVDRRVPNYYRQQAIPATHPAERPPSFIVTNLMCCHESSPVSLKTVPFPMQNNTSDGGRLNDENEITVLMANIITAAINTMDNLKVLHFEEYWKLLLFYCILMSLRMFLIVSFSVGMLIFRMKVI